MLARKKNNQKVENMSAESLTTNKGRKIDGLMSDKMLEIVSKSAIMVTNGQRFEKTEKESKKMNKVNMGEKYDKRITLRLNEKQYDFIIGVSEILGVSPSDYLRMVVNSGMVTMQKAEDNTKGTVGTHENVKANSNDIV